LVGSYGAKLGSAAEINSANFVRRYTSRDQVAPSALGVGEDQLCSLESMRFISDGLSVIKATLGTEPERGVLIEWFRGCVHQMHPVDVRPRAVSAINYDASAS
jgi:hypothetical protein